MYEVISVWRKMTLKLSRTKVGAANSIMEVK